MKHRRLRCITLEVWYRSTITNNNQKSKNKLCSQGARIIGKQGNQREWEGIQGTAS